MLKVVVVGYGKMLAALVSGARAKGHTVVGALRCDRVNYSKFTLFFKDILVPSYDYSFLKSYGIYDIKASSVNSKEFENQIKQLDADIILVGSWSEKFLPKILNTVKYGVINCHPSLLPFHRGANPYFWAICNGDTKTGVTFHYMDENYDTGDILMQASFDIDFHMTGETLRNKASKVAEIMTGELLDDIEKNRIVPVVQNAEGSYDKYPVPDIDILDFNLSAFEIYNKVRGAYPWFYTRCSIGDKVYKVKKCLPASYNNKWSDIPNGQIIEMKNKLITVKCRDSAVRLYVF